MNWKADSLHFVAFGNAPAAVDSLQPWLRVFGGSPQQLQTAPIGQPPYSLASGVVGEYQFMISSNPGRIELALSPGAHSNGPPEAIGDWRAALDVLLGHTTLASENMGAHRVAIVANFSQQAQSPFEAAEMFRQSVSLQSLPDNAVDLSFGFNLVKPIAGLQAEMNRLCRWSTGIQQFVGMQLVSGGSAPAISMQVRHVANLQVDLNTSIFDLQDSVLRKSVTEQLSSELISIAEGGYGYLVS